MHVDWSPLIMMPLLLNALTHTVHIDWSPLITMPLFIQCSNTYSTHRLEPFDYNAFIYSMLQQIHMHVDWSPLITMPLLFNALTHTYMYTYIGASLITMLLLFNVQDHGLPLLKMTNSDTATCTCILHVYTVPCDFVC